MYRTLRLCAQGGGFEALPDPPGTLDLVRIRGDLERARVPVVDARVMLIASLDPEVTISRAGRLLFKTPDAATAERALERLRRLTDLDGAVRGRRPGATR
jgi:hypothetical protein